MPRKDYWEEAYKIQQEYDRKLARLDRELINAVAGKYTQLTSSLEKKIEALSLIKGVSPDEIRRLAVYTEYVAELDKKMVVFGYYTEGVIKTRQQIFIQLGIQSTQKMISLVNVSFQKLNVGALDWMIGNSIEGGRLYELLAKSYPDTVKRITDTLIESVAIGRNPRVTARLISEDMGGNLSRALRVSRTETIVAYRESQFHQMKLSGLVNEWERIEQTDACPFCLERMGKRYPLDTIFETHPNCRGTMIPVLA